VVDLQPILEGPSEEVMDSPAELAQLARGLEQMRLRLLDLMRETADPQLREQMQVAADRLQGSAVPFVKDYPKLQADVEKRLADTRQSAQQTIARAEELQRKAAELEELAKQPPPPSPPEPPLDPALGGQLRDELLKLFSDQPEAAAGVPAGGSLWSFMRDKRPER
jgi:hypothetical protein